MTTQTTTIRRSRKDARAFIGAAAASLAVLGGALLWQARPTGQTAAPVATTSSSTISEGVAPLGGLAELYQQQAGTAAAAREAQVTAMGGMAELYAAQAAEAAAPAHYTLVVGAQHEIAEAYAALVERLRALDGTTPFEVTVVLTGAVE